MTETERKITRSAPKLAAVMAAIRALAAAILWASAIPLRLCIRGLRELRGAG